MLAVGGCAETAPPVVAPTTAEVDAVLAAKVPEPLRLDGKLVVGVDPALPPAEFLDDKGAVTGFNADLFRAVGERLGLAVEYERAPFDSLVTRVNAGTYEVGVSSITITDARKQQALLVSYFQAGTQWYARAGTALDTQEPCGRTVAVRRASVQETDLAVRAKACADGKKPALTVQAYERSETALAAVLEGRVDAALVDSTVGGHAVLTSNAELSALGEPYGLRAYGIVVAKAQQALAEAIRDAVASLVGDGTYWRILATWGVTNGAIKEPKINP